jgi:hypothetical protein
VTTIRVVGLHNKFPAHFYKRGNLFNTYLGSGEESHRLSSKSRTGHAPKRTVHPPPAKRTGHPDQEALVAFVQRYLTLGQMEDWRRLTSSAHGADFTPAETSAYHEIAGFIHGNLSPSVCRRYLIELERRRSLELPLVCPDR